DSFALAASTDALNRLFSNDIAPLRHLRDLGLGIVDSIGPARRFFMRHAGGDVGKLPRLMRGELLSVAGYSYIRVRWQHGHADEPVDLWSELDAARLETRKLEIFRDGRIGYASADEE